MTGIGYVGLGNMGGALARRLHLQHALQVFDLDATSVAKLVAHGARASESLAELASSCELIFLCLPTSDHVRTAIFGASGLAAGLRAGTIIVDQSTGHPEATREMASLLSKRQVTLVDAPVSGGVHGAQAGTISIMVGADEKEFIRIQPILAAIGRNIFHAGGVGAGQAMKLANNLLSGVQRLLTMEAVALAVKNGIDAEKACEILMAGGARNSFLEKFMAPHVVKGRLDAGFTLGLMHKDLRLACDLGSSSGVPLFFGNQAREFYQMCIGEMGGDAQVNTAALVMDRLAHCHVVPVTPVDETKP